MMAGREKGGVSLLLMHDISKSFAGVQVLDRISFDVRQGEVHALCGENGAGKSTLMKILGGVFPASGGGITLDGRPMRWRHAPPASASSTRNSACCGTARSPKTSCSAASRRAAAWSTAGKWKRRRGRRSTVSAP
jgi:ABC-type cobalamin/Fe3+-siderophores transport system ATPase subunit